MLARHFFQRRGIAVILAALLTLGPLVALQFSPAPHSQSPSREPVAYLSLRLSTSAQVDQNDPRPPTKSKPKFVNPNRQIVTSGPISIPPAGSITPQPEKTMETSTPLTEVAEAPQQTASAPIRLDASTIRSANFASKSDVRKMAEASGAYIGDTPLSESEKLAAAIAQTAKEDCLGPNAGGSLLSVFVIPYMAARGKCK